MSRVFADERLGRVGRGLFFTCAVVCVDQIESRLARLVREREAGGQLLVRFDRRVVVVRVQSLLGLFIQDLGARLRQLAVLVCAGP